VVDDSPAFPLACLGHHFCGNPASAPLTGDCCPGRACSWSAAQKQSNTPAAVERAIAQAKASGSLNLTSRGLTEVPAELCDWHGSAQPGDKWWEVVELSKLDLSHNELQDLPEPLFKSLSGLQTLHVGNNALRTLPPALRHCAGTLKLLNVQHNALAELPPPVGALESLVHLSVDYNALQSLPDALCDLAHVEVLVCSFNKLAALPARLGAMRALTRLDAASNALIALPDSIGDLARLMELELGHNRLAALPPGLARLSALVRLDCRENALSSASEVPAAPSLAELLLGFNRLAALPRALPPALATLDVRDNAIEELDAEPLLALPRLRSLDLRNNALARLPPRLGLCTALTALLLDGNPLRAVRRALLAAPARELLEYLRGRIEDGAPPPPLSLVPIGHAAPLTPY
jgi:Leucine-rich repeat (LRR) protein